MQCLRPLKGGFDSSYNITFSKKKFNPEIEAFEFPCRKCLPCRLNIAREKSIRCFHEAQQFEENIFLTLTYAPEHLKSEKLIYEDFQLFMKKLRKHIEPRKIGYMVTGEYGELNKRPHWHAIIFNFRPSDSKFDRTTETGEKVYVSELINNLWKLGKTEFGSVTLDSASYVARYAAKKLVHGNDQDHDYHPIHRTSSKHAIGKKWIEKNFNHTFNMGYIILPNGEKSKIPRYYQDWLKQEHPEKYIDYVTRIRPKIIEKTKEKEKIDEEIFLKNLATYEGGKYPLKQNQVKETILKRKFKRLQEMLKL